MIVRISRKRDVHARFRAPPSKSATHRAYIVAALARGTSSVQGPLQSDDTEVTRKILSEWGTVFTDRDDGVRIEGSGGVFHCPPGQKLDMRDSGTSMRFCSSLGLLCHTPVILDGSPRMRERPIGALVRALNTLGGRIRFLDREGYPPLCIEGNLQGGEVIMSGEESSQYISSILLAAPCAEEDITVRCEKIPVSRSYIDITLSIMRHFGARWEREGYLTYHVRSGDLYQGSHYEVEGDFSSAAYFLAIPAICGGSVLVGGLDPSSTQGDRIVLDILEAMGCGVRWTSEGVEVSREGNLEGVQVDLSSAPDLVQTLCMVAACARSPTTITGVGHLRLKESDRLEAIGKILRDFGAGVRIDNETITVMPARLHGGVVDPGGDHRTAMSAAILGLGIGDVMILQAECVRKSFPEFWDRLREAGLL